MADFERKLLKIYNNNRKFYRHRAAVIRQMFNESEFEFNTRLSQADEDDFTSNMMQLYDILIIDYYYKEVNNTFINWAKQNYYEDFSQEDITIMEAQSEAYLDFYEIQDVVQGKGSHIKSLFTDREVFLSDVSSSYGLTKWDIVLVRCYRIGRKFFATGALNLFSPDDKKFIIDDITKAFKEYKNNTNQTDYANFAKANWNIFFRTAKKVREKRENKEFFTPYGKLQYCEVRWKVKNYGHLAREINKYQQFSFIEKKIRRDKKRKLPYYRYEFEWNSEGIEEELQAIKIPMPDHGIFITNKGLDDVGNELGVEYLGSLFIDPKLCRLEISSLELAEFAIEHFSRIFGDSLVFKRLLKKKLNMEKIKERSNETEDTEIPPELSDVLQGTVENLILKVLDEKIPALNNLTPREARRDAEALPLLIEWLKSYENNLIRDTKFDGKKIIDDIKRELDLFI